MFSNMLGNVEPRILINSDYIRYFQARWENSFLPRIYRILLQVVDPRLILFFFTSARRRASITATDKHFLIAAGEYEGVIFYVFRLKKVDHEKMKVHRS